MKKFVLVLALMAGLSLSAQPTGTLRIFVSPPAETVMIDDTELVSGNTADLKPGKYFLKAWAPGKKVLDTIVEINAGEINNFYYRFKPSTTFMTYKKEMAAYNNQRAKHFILPVATTTVVAGSLLFTYFKGRQIREDAYSVYDDYKYANNPSDLSDSKQEYRDLQSKYQGYVTAYYIEWGAMAVSSYFLYKGIQWLRNNKTPEYKADDNPLALGGLGMGRDPYGNYTLGLTINIR